MPVDRTLVQALRREIALVAAAAGYEMRKHSAFRIGFLVREALRGTERTVAMTFVYLALFRASRSPTIRGFTLTDMVHYLLLVATFQKLLIHERALDISEQIFDGTITKFITMPVRYFTLVLGRWVQFTLVQGAVAAVFWTAGALLLPRIWPRPVSPLAAAEALTLVLLGSYCFHLLFFMVHTLAFWLDMVWSLLAMSRMVTGFVMGELVPVAMMPPALRDAFVWLFPYWTVSAPIEIFLGRLGTPWFLRGALILLASIAILQTGALLLWRRGLRRYAGAGM